MKVPNADKAVVDKRKLTDYCLSFDHPRGRHKARVFQSVLGLTMDDADELRHELLAKVQAEECQLSDSDVYGERYVVDFPFRRMGKEAMIRSTWIIKAAEDFPRLTSCFVL